MKNGVITAIFAGIYGIIAIVSIPLVAVGTSLANDPIGTLFGYAFVALLVIGIFAVIRLGKSNEQQPLTAFFAILPMILFCIGFAYTAGIIPH